MTLTQKQAELRSSLIVHESISYHFHLLLQSGTHYRGLAEIDFEVKEINDNIFLDFASPKIYRLVINGSEVKEYKHSDGFLFLDAENLRVGKNAVAVFYENKYDNDGNGLVSFIDVDEKQYLYTNFEPYYANRVFALFDQPDLKATMELSVIYPTEWETALSNEYSIISQQFDQEKYINSAATSSKDLLIDFSKQQQGGRMAIFPKTKMLPTYLFCLIVGPYKKLDIPHQYNNIPMSLYSIESLFPYLQKLAPFLFDTTVECMKFFESYFGYPYSFNKYDQVFVHQFKSCAMENAGIVTFTDTYIWKEDVSDEKMLDLADTISHELSHHWFGDLVTMKWWDDLWLNESFAEFISYLSLEKIQAKLSYIKFESSMAQFFSRKNWGYSDDQAVTTHPIRGEVENTSIAESIFDGITYAKGAATMKQLLFLMGDENYSAALKSYFTKYAFKNATLSDFIQELQKHLKSTDLNLEEWKRLWLQKASLNILEPVWGQTDKETSTRTLQILQTPYNENYETLRPHKIKIALFREDVSYEVVETLVSASKKTTIKISNGEQYEAVLLNYEDHTFAKTALDEQSISFFMRNLIKISDMLTRTQIWRIFYDSVADAAIASTKYIDLFVANIGNEPSDSIIERNFEDIFISISKYTPEVYRAELYTRIFYFILQLLSKVDKKLENRVIILKQNLCQFAQCEIAIRELIRWNAGVSEALKDQTLTEGLRWKIIIKAHTLHDLSREVKLQLLESQMSKEISDNSLLQAATCKSLSSTDEQFEEIYNELKNQNSEKSSTMKRSIAKGWNNSYHRERLRKYKKRYFADLPQVAQKLSGQSLDVFILSLAPIDDELQQNISFWQGITLEGSKLAKNRIQIRKIIDGLEKRLKAYRTFEKLY